MTDWHPTSIDGVWRRTNDAIGDERGSFTELWRASRTTPLGSAAMVQANLSRSRAGVLRGMHFHERQSDLWLLLEGEAAAAVTDLRSAVRGDGTARSETVQLRAGDALYIPPLVAHGFLALTDITLVYLVSNEYDGTDERGFAWDDADAAVEWPDAPAIVSDRDRANPPLSDVIAGLRQAQSERA
jgi:dTDP-4-dehydrorhamnose 3,5-epimerase